MKKYIIDGYNLLNSPEFNAPLQLDLQDQRNHLIRLIKSHSHFEPCAVTIIFDNSLSFQMGRIKKDGRIVIRFTNPSMEADELIRVLIRKEKKPAELIVVSSDRAIQYAAKDHGARVLSSEDYCRLMRNKQNPLAEDNPKFIRDKYEPNLDEQELDFWKRLFERDEDE